MKGKHTASVVDVGIIDRGRNVASCSRDGTLLMWECGSSACIDELSAGNGIINACHVTDAAPDTIAKIFNENYESTQPKGKTSPTKRVMGQNIS